MGDDDAKLKGVVKTAAKVAAAAALVSVSRNDVHNEVDRVTFAGIPLFSRDQETGAPRVLGIPFRRWARGKRR